MASFDPAARCELGRTGVRVSPLGFGASPLGNEFGTVEVRVFPRNVAFARLLLTSE